MAEISASASASAPASLTTSDGRPLKTALREAQVKAKRRAFLLVLPLLLFVVLTFILPIGQMLHRSIYHDGFSAAAPTLVAWFAENPPGTEPDEAAFAALAADLANPKSESAKLDDLIELLDGEVSTQRVLIFTKYRQCAVFASIKLARFKPYMIHGGVSLAQRDDIRRRFCSAGGLGRILIGTEAMARGLNLQDASVVVNLDLPWNHAKLRQRVGRVARIGQKSRSVLVISYVAEGFAYAPIDRYFLGLVRKKRDLSDRVYGEDSVDELDSAPVDLGAVRAFLRSR